MADGLRIIRVPFQSLDETLAKYTVPELQQELKRRGLKRSGVKNKLIQRLKEAIELEEGIIPEKNTAVDFDQNSSSFDGSQSEDSSHVQYAEKGKGMFDLADPYSEYESSIPGVTNAEDENGMQQQSVAEPQMMTEEPIQSDNIDTTVTHDGMSQNEPDSQRYEEPFVEANLFEQQLSESKEENLFLHRDESIERDIEDEEERPVIDMLQVAEEQDEAKADQEENQIAEVLKIQTEESNIGETSDFEREDVYDRTKEVYDQREELPMAMQQEIEDARIVGNDVENAEESCNILDNGKEMVPFGQEIEAPDDNLEIQSENEQGSQESREDSQEPVNEDKEVDQEDIGFEVNVSRNDTDDIDDVEGESQEKSEEVAKQEAKPEKKSTTPVQIKKRKIVVPESESSSKGDVPVPRKRRWGSSSHKESVAISSESLKGLIPDISIIPTANDDPLGLGLDYGEMEEGEISDTMETEAPVDDDTEEKDGDDADMENEEGKSKNEGHIKKEMRRGRIVRISTKDTVKISRTESHETGAADTTETETAKKNDLEVKVKDEKISLLPDVSAEDPDFVRERSPSPAKNAPSTILSIRNLVRPFTLRQLREFLSKTGTVVDDGFWIDRIKSHCYVTYATEEEATLSRAAIHGTRWPSANPKLLAADFAINDEMYRETEGKLGQAQKPVKIEEPKPRKQEERARERPKEAERSRERDVSDRSRDRMRDKENKVTEESVKPKEKKEAPARLLDDLFRKTKATPCIYWLPLTKEQVAARDKGREIRREERKSYHDEMLSRENKEREERRRQREADLHRQDRPRERQSPQRYESRSRPRSDSQDGARKSPQRECRPTRQLPAQYRPRKPSTSSSSSSSSSL